MDALAQTVPIPAPMDISLLEAQPPGLAQSPGMKRIGMAKHRAVQVAQEPNDISLYGHTTYLFTAKIHSN